MRIYQDVCAHSRMFLSSALQSAAVTKKCSVDFPLFPSLFDATPVTTLLRGGTLRLVKEV